MSSRPGKAAKQSPGASPAGVSVPATEWDKVKKRHRDIVRKLNETPVSFTVPSAEGLAMYEGLDSHAINGEIGELARAAHTELVARAKRELAGEPQPDTGNGTAPAGKPEPPAPATGNG